MINFKNIDKNNYMECITLKVNDDQKDFVADNAQSLLDAHYLDNINTLAIYNDNTMVGFILYDYDEELNGWSISRFMIGKEYQGNGLGTESLKSFLEYFKENVGDYPLYACVNINNTNTLSLFKKFGFNFIEDIEYTFLGKIYKEKKLRR